MPNSQASTRRRIGVSAALAVALAALITGSLGASSAAVPANTKLPTIAGSALVGKDLTGDRGDWTGGGITYSYRWIRCDKNVANCVPIAGATGTRYTLVSTDLGATIRFEVTGTNNDGKSVATSGPTAEVSNGTGVPASTAPPTIGGSPTVGTTLTSTTGTWIGDAPITYQYQWQRCDKNGNACKNIGGGATKDTYKVADADANSTLRLKVTAKNARGKSSAISVQTALVGGSSGGGGKAIDVSEVPKGERLIVDKVTFSPSPVKSRSTSITVTIVVKDTRGNLVKNAFVFLRSTPIVTSTPTDAQTGGDGAITYSVKPESDFPIKNGYSVQFYVKAYKKGDPVLAGISGSRLVQVPTAK